MMGDAALDGTLAGLTSMKVRIAPTVDQQGML